MPNLWITIENCQNEFSNRQYNFIRCYLLALSGVWFHFYCSFSATAMAHSIVLMSSFLLCMCLVCVCVCVWSSYYECTSHCVVWLKWRTFLIFIDQTRTSHNTLYGPTLMLKTLAFVLISILWWSCFLRCSLTFGSWPFHKIAFNQGAFYQTVLRCVSVFVWCLTYIWRLNWFGQFATELSTSYRYSFVSRSFRILWVPMRLYLWRRRCRKMVCHHGSDPCVGMWTKVKIELDAFCF